MTTKYTLFYKRTLFTTSSPRTYQPFYTLLTLSKALTFKVTRQNPELIPPAKPTPNELKPLSSIDNEDCLRVHVPIIQFYRKNPFVKANPAEVIRKAIAEALVPYYPLAGRLREHAATKKLTVECNGEGVMFIEAAADVTLQQFGDELQPPAPHLDELLYDVPGSDGIIGAPLLLIQVTRLKCDGFIFAVRFNHTVVDGVGIVQFMSAVGEFARGAKSPSVQPIWERHLLDAHAPSRVPSTHDEYHELPNTGGTIFPLDDMVESSAFFGAAEISALRSHLPPHLRGCTTTFELLTACVWRCRTIALSPEPNEEVRIMWPLNCRRRFDPPIPDGYYGNCFVGSPSAIATAENLSKKPFHFAVELVRKIKAESLMADRTTMRGGPLSLVGTYAISDVRRLGFGDVDFGWGKPIYGGLAKSSMGAVPGLTSFYVPFKNNKGENGTVVTICLPTNAMNVFKKELETMVR